MKKGRIEKTVILWVIIFLLCSNCISLFYCSVFVLKTLYAIVFWKPLSFEPFYIALLGMLPQVFLSLQWFPSDDTYARLAVSGVILFIQSVTVCGFYYVAHKVSGMTLAILCFLFLTHLLVMYIVGFYFRCTWKAIAINRIN